MTRSSLPVGVNKLKRWWDDESRVLRCTLPFQRHAGVWSAYTKSNLIWSLLADSYIPPIILLKDKSGVDGKGKDTYIYEILDGQQRLTNIFSYINDEWALHSATQIICFDGFEYEVAGKRYSELEDELRNAIDQYRFTIQCLENYTMEEAESLFFNINSGVALSPVQKAKSKMGTDLIKFFSSLLSGTFFTQAVNITEAQAKREDDLLMLLQTALLLDNRHEGLEYKTISAAFCLSYAEGIRNTYNEDKQHMLTGVVDYLDNAFTFKNKFMSKNNVPIVIVIAKVAMEQGIEAKTFAGFVNTFANCLYPSYKEASGSGNVKVRLVQMRLRVMFLALCKHFDLDAEKVKKPFSDEIELYDGILPEDGLLPVRGISEEPIRGENLETGESAPSSDEASGDVEISAGEAGGDNE